MDEPKTIPEQLDAAQDGEEFKDVFLGWLGALGKARDEAEADE